MSDFLLREFDLEAAPVREFDLEAAPELVEGTNSTELEIQSLALVSTKRGCDDGGAASGFPFLDKLPRGAPALQDSFVWDCLSVLPMFT
mmetsp:Transcript_159805/g.294683  ORF Transcript_159805/g.294683 Transcript_159805/m.294683 type:complete len:89 (-) Transcript_159805:5-271(-)